MDCFCFYNQKQIVSMHCKSDRFRLLCKTDRFHALQIRCIAQQIVPVCLIHVCQTMKWNEIKTNILCYFADWKWIKIKEWRCCETQPLLLVYTLFYFLRLLELQSSKVYFWFMMDGLCLFELQNRLIVFVCTAKQMWFCAGLQNRLKPCYTQSTDISYKTGWQLSRFCQPVLW